MRKNKLLSIICALAMMMTMFSSFVVANADGDPQVTVKISNPSAKDDEVKFEISFANIPDGAQIKGFQAVMPLDTDVFEYVSADNKFGETSYGTRGGAKVTFAFAATSSSQYVSDKSGVATTWTLKLVAADAELNKEYPISFSSMKLTLETANGNVVYGLSSDTGTTNTYTPTIPTNVKVEEKKEASDPTITGVTVDPKTATVKAGETQKFTATVAGTDGLDKDLTTTIPYNKDVTWSVDNTDAASIAADGTLSVKETAQAGATITVTATSVGDATKKDTATVKVGGAAVELTVTADTSVSGYTTQAVSISKAADADEADVTAFKTAVNGNKAVVLVTGKTADDVVVGSAYVIVDGATIADGIDAGAVALGTVGITGAAKCEVSVIVNGNVVAK